MPDLHQRLLALVDDPPYDGPARALRAVVELHAPKPYQDRPGSSIIECRGCDVDGYEWEWPPWPCSTVQAIARELGVEVPS